MGAVTVVVLGEGAGDLGGEAETYGPPVPRAPLLNDALGPAHLLIRRALVHARDLPEASVQFERPLLLGTGREARGSDLLVSKRLGQLLTYPPVSNRPSPHLAVLLVDEDGESGRRADLHNAVPQSASGPLVVVAVAVREFESWLISDPQACKQLGLSDPPNAPEGLDPGEAKAWLSEQATQDKKATRRDLACTIDLEKATERCPSLQELIQSLGSVLDLS